MTAIRPEAILRRSRQLGPAFVAAVAYVDPGNVATNTQAGARYGYLLLWVLVAATIMAALVQYLSAKLGWLTGESLPGLVGSHTSRPVRLAFWVQAELVAMATDVAEILGGAIALQLLLGLPLLLGALVTIGVSTGLLLLQSVRRQRTFERVITGLLGVVAVGFVAGLVASPPDSGPVLDGLVPRLDGADSVLLAVGMLGATVMPHAVYLHSALIRDRHGRADERTVRRGLTTIRTDVILAMVFAGGVNLAMLLVSGNALAGLELTGLPDIHAAVGRTLGPLVAGLFALSLLASGLASSSVGGYAGSVIMAGLLARRVPVLVRRIVTGVPALILLATGLDPTHLLILSQVVLSFGIPFALFPLVLLTRSPRLMALAPTRRGTTAAAWLVTGIITVLNVALIVLLAA